MTAFSCVPDAAGVVEVVGWLDDDGAGGGEVGCKRSRIHEDFGKGFERDDFARAGVRGCLGIGSIHKGSISVAPRAALQRSEGGGGGGLKVDWLNSRCSFWKFS